MKLIRLTTIFLVAISVAGTSFSQELVLPDDFPLFSLDQYDDPDPGYLFIFARPQTPNKYPGYLQILDNRGIPVFYRHLPHQSGLFKIQPSGLLSYLKKDSEYNQVYLMDQSFQIVDSVWMEDFELDSHDFIAMENGHFLIFGRDIRTIDMSAVVEGGQTDATVKGCVIQELDEDKNVVFEWNSFDHFQLTDSYKDLTVSSIDFDHPNSLEIDADGNILLISRALNEVTKIDRQTGDIIWRLGGKNNQFEFADSSHMFSMPHKFRRLENGNYTIFDNGTERDPSYTRAVEYAIDQENKTIEMVWEYDADKTVFSRSGGSAQRLPSGNTLLCYGGQVSNPSVTEVHPDGSVAFRLGFVDPNIRSGSATKHTWKTTLFSTNTDTVKYGEWDGYTYSVYILKIKNQSGKELELTDYHLHTNAFLLDENLFPLTLAPNEEKSINLFYYPYDIDSSAVNDVLTINSDINTDTLVQRIAVQVYLTGTKLYSAVEDYSTDHIRIYPNPAHDYVSISSRRLQKGKIMIYSMNGSEVYHQDIYDNHTSVNLKQFDKGMYIIEIYDESSDKYYRKKIVKL